MTRPLRIQFPGAIYHLTARGNGPAAIFLDDFDREVFLSRFVGQCLLGEKPFLEKLSPYLEEKAALTEIARAQRFAVRPPLDRLLPGVRSALERDQETAKAHLEHGYSQREIAARVGLHYSTVSRIVQREREKARSKT